MIICRGFFFVCSPDCEGRGCACGRGAGDIVQRIPYIKDTAFVRSGHFHIFQKRIGGRLWAGDIVRTYDSCKILAEGEDVEDKFQFLVSP